MKKYKPEYLGKVLPEDKTEMSDFMHNKYEGFSKVFDICKCESDKIIDIAPVKISTDNTKSYSVKVSADTCVLKNISDNNKDDTIKISGDTITSE